MKAVETADTALAPPAAGNPASTPRLSILRHILWTFRSQWWPAEHIKGWQEQALVATMRHACIRVPFYRSLGIDPGSISSAGDLERFPPLDKGLLQANPSRFLAEGFHPAALHSSRTSGSTGEPTITYFDAQCWALCKYALKARRTLSTAPAPPLRCIIVSEQPSREAAAYGHQRAYGVPGLYRERVLSLFDDLAVHRRALAEFQPNLLYAFPSYLCELALAYEKAGQPPPRIPVIFTSSEVLTAGTRMRIEQAFGAVVRDVYGSTEFKEVAWQCRHGSYHLNFEAVHAEVGPAAPHGDTGPLLLTTLCNRAMPLLRFRTGDLAALQSGVRCACGRSSPRLLPRMGREGEVLQLPRGRRLSPYLLTMSIEALPGLRQYRIRHLAPASLRIEIIADPKLDLRALDDCRRRLMEVLGEPMDLEITRVERLSRGPGGKHKVFVKEFG